MEKPNLCQSEALRQIDDLYAIVSGNLKVVISGRQMIAVGIGIALIPFIEIILRSTLDPFISSIVTTPPPVIFALRTIFYWSSFGALSLLFKETEKRDSNDIMEKIVSIGKFFPIIPISTAAALAMTNNANIISPIILILIGTIFTWFGQFTSRVVSTVAWANIAAGIGGILLSTHNIKHLWAYLVVYQGCTFIAMGASLWYLQSTEKK